MKRFLMETLRGVIFSFSIFAVVVLLFWVSGQNAHAATWTELGEHRITHFCNCSRCCGRWAGGLTASGTVPTRYQTVAVDPKEIPLGSTIYIEGYGYRIAEDTGVSSGTIDVFCPDHQLCLQYGVKRKKVWIVE